MKVTSYLNNINTTAVWLILMAITIMNYAVGGLGFSGNIVVGVLLSATAIKGVLIIRDFMGLQGVSLLWRIIMYGWLWVVCITVAIIYFIGS